MTKFIKHLITLCIYGITYLGASAATLPATLDEALSMLREAFDNCDDYYKTSLAKVDSLKKTIHPGTPSEIGAIAQLAQKYRIVNVDSSIHYFNTGINRAKILGDSCAVQRLRLMKSAILPLTGACIEAEESFDSLTREYIYPANRTLLLESGHDMLFYLATTYPMRARQRAYAMRAAEITNRLIDTLSTDDPWRKLYMAEMSYLKKDYTQVAALTTEILEQQPFESHLFALSAALLADYYTMQPGKEDEAFYYRILSAIADLRNGNREEESLQQVGKVLMDRGDIDLAYQCMSLSLANAVQCGARIRSIRIAEGMPVIERAYLERDQHKLNILLWMVIALLIALLVIVGILFFLRREMRVETQLRKSLKDANVLKESFINQFLNLCSIYIKKLEEFIRMSTRKIKAGQVEDLYNTLKSGKTLEEQKAIFCDIFDNAFTKIYPTFVTEVNALLQPDKQIPTPEPGRLNTELRILAFMRLGIDDSAKIAGFLNLSVNTIYTYRNKLKGKAICRETFEQSVMKIAQIS